MPALTIDGALREQGRAAAAWLAGPAGRRILAALLLALAGLAGFTLYESVALGLPLTREEPPSFDAYHLARSAFAVIASALVVAALVRGRARPSPLDVEALGRRSLAVGLAMLAAAAATTALAILDPQAFHYHAQEDRPLEWASAGLLFAAGALAAADAVRRFSSGGRRIGLPLLVAGGLAALMLVMAMEEISWGQRLFGFATPDALAEVNWQGEFNFHNIQTDLTETVYFTGAAILLILVPLLRDLLVPAIADHKLLDFAPRRGVALVGAPLAFFNYGHWNLLPIQLCCGLSLFALLVFARAAGARCDRAEQAAFLLAAGVLAAGQALLLVYGSAMVELPDATEYKELFIAFGFAWYALGLATRPDRPVSAAAGGESSPARAR